MRFGLVFLFGCGGEMADQRKQIEIAKVDENLVARQRQQVKELRKETECIQIYLSDMKLQQQAPIEDWIQPSFEQYEETGCARTMRPIR